MKKEREFVNLYAKSIYVLLHICTSTYRQTLAIWFVVPRDCFLPKELVRKLEGKNVDFAVHPLDVTMAAVILNLLGNLAFPLMLLGSLLLRSSSVNTPGSPNLPFGLGMYGETLTHFICIHAYMTVRCMYI